MFFYVQNVQLKRSIEEINSYLCEYSERSDFQIDSLKSELIESLKSEIRMISENQNKNTNELLIDLAEIKNKSELQYVKTVGIKNTYDALLEEQKKKTVDMAEIDNESQKKKIESLILYNKGKFVLSFEGFAKLLQLDATDMESRIYKMKSLYYMNPADSAKYPEILEDIRILKMNSMADDECIEIEKAVKIELEGINE